MSERPRKIRDFADRSGVRWRVTEMTRTAAVDPRPRERRAEARSAERAFPAAERLTTRPLDLPWLCFESSTERRRLSPMPNEWYDLPDDELEDLIGLSQKL